MTHQVACLCGSIIVSAELARHNFTAVTALCVASGAASGWPLNAIVSPSTATGK
jgi:hypothetical protein